jgi:NMD protein affecting ribosome stability and mRNA decay
MGIYMKIEENCSRCGKYAKLKNGLCPRCIKEDKEKEGK